ncbi:MAG: hypothetical protein PHE78_05635 [Candidatus Gastranaerophilales bacterium]|nr:hypothetical protein [Candidatus Gastranaerophilales bacterium]
MNVANIISIIGNNTSVTPILVKDGIESSAKVYLADKQGNKVSKEQGFYEAREAAIEEFGTSAIWFLGPIAVAKTFNAVGKKVLKLQDDTFLKTDSKLLDGKHFQTLDKNVNELGDEFVKKEAAKIKTDKLAKLAKTRNLLGVGATIGLLAWLTLFKQKVTRSSIEKHGVPQGITFQGYVRDKVQAHPTFAAFTHDKNKSKEPSFKGVGELVAQASIDAGVGAVRVGTARDKDERKEYVFNTLAFITLNYLTAPFVEKGMNYLAKKANLPINLDAKVIADKGFAEDIVNASKDATAKEKMLDFVSLDNAKGIDKEEKIIKFIDSELKKAHVDEKGNFKEFNNKTLEYARKSGLITIEKNNKRAINKFIDTDAVEAVNKSIKDVIDVTTQKGAMPDFFKKLKATKYGTVLANIAICSALVGVVLPKLRYAFREKGIGTVASPGVKAYDHQHHITKKA